MASKSSFLYGALCVLAGGLCLSAGGILLRHVQEASGWEILFYRSLTFFCFVAGIVTARYRGRTLEAYRSIEMRGLIVAAALAVAAIAYVFSILQTTVANTVFIIGASPLVTAVIGWWILRERVSALGIAFMFTALMGIGLMFADGVVAGRWVGNLIAVLVVLCFAVMLVTLRSGRAMDMLPATSLAGLFSAAAAGLMAEDFRIIPHDLLIAVLLGTIQYGAGFVLITIGTRHVSAPEVALFSLSEAILAPVWVWVGVGEVPSTLTLVGSAVVLFAVAAHCFTAMRRESRAETPMVSPAGTTLPES